MNQCRYTSHSKQERGNTRHVRNWRHLSYFVAEYIRVMLEFVTHHLFWKSSYPAILIEELISLRTCGWGKKLTSWMISDEDLTCEVASCITTYGFRHLNNKRTFRGNIPWGRGSTHLSSSYILPKQAWSLGSNQSHSRIWDYFVVVSSCWISFLCRLVRFLQPSAPFLPSFFARRLFWP